MKLTDEGLLAKNAWAEKGYTLPSFDRRAMRERTQKAPLWLHFGPGNLFRAFLSPLVQRMLENGSLDRGLTVAESRPGDLLETVLDPYNLLSLLVTLKADGTMEKTVVASIAEACKLGEDRLAAVFSAPSLQLVTFTITE